MPRKGRNIYKRKDDRWKARVCYSGSKKYKSVYGKTFREAIAKQDKLRAEMTFPDKADHLISTLAECWLEDKKHTVKKSTFYAYLTKINKHILPYFSETRFSVLNEQVLSGFVAAKRGENLSEKYICDMVILIKAISSWVHQKYGVPDKIKDFRNVRPIIREPEMLSLNEQKKAPESSSELR